MRDDLHMILTCRYYNYEYGHSPLGHSFPGADGHETRSSPVVYWLPSSPTLGTAEMPLLTLTIEYVHMHVNMRLTVSVSEACWLPPHAFWSILA